MLTRGVVESRLQLGAPFKVKLEAPHVVDMRKQVWAGVVPQGPGGVTLDVSGSVMVINSQLGLGLPMDGMHRP